MKKKISIIGLGYVGLPLAVSFSKYFNVIGFDINNNRIKQLKKGNDITNEINLKKKYKKTLKFTSDEKDLQKTDIFIVTVPTPINKKKTPDLSALKSASKLVGNYITYKNLVIFESTVYPGCTEEVCIPIIEKVSNLISNKDFFYGYSPERINPGDKKNTLEKVIKIVSGSNNQALRKISLIYKKIIKAGIYKAQTIKVAEAAKIIENIQRDINIAFMNEVFLIFNNLNINSKEVFKAANTKWNFLNFKPGLVGGHCIGVDPYYLAYKAKLEKCSSEILLTGRNINAKMYQYVVKNTLKKIKDRKKPTVLLLGQTFKENVPDVRNSQAVTVFDTLKKKKLKFLPMIQLKFIQKLT